MSTDIKEWQQRQIEMPNQSSDNEFYMAEEIADLRAELARRDAVVSDDWIEQTVTEEFDKRIHATSNDVIRAVIARALGSAVVSEGQAVAWRDLETLARLAEGTKFSTEGFEQTVGSGDFYGGLIMHENGHTIIAQQVMEPWASFIAAANPATILTLLAELARPAAPPPVAKLPPLPESQANGDNTTDFHGRLFKHTDETLQAYAHEAVKLARAAAPKDGSPIGEVVPCEDYGITIRWADGVPKIGTRLYTHPAAPAPEAPTASQAPEVAAPTLTERDLAMLVQRLIRALAKISPDSDLIESSYDYLQRKGLQGSPLRTLGERLRDANAPKPFPSKKGI